MNSFGTLFRLTSAGESHGPAMVAIVDGCPAGVEISVAEIQQELERRRPGRNAFTSPRAEIDQVEILSGIFEGKTTGVPIALLIKNHNAQPKDYEAIKNTFRPGHADFTYHHKYGHRDYRGSGRASARETVLRVAAGAIAKKILQQNGITVQAYIEQIGTIKAEQIVLEQVEQNPFYFADPAKLAAVEKLIHTLKEAGDSIGASVTVVAKGVPVGLGEPVYGKLSVQLAAAMMSINAVKGVEIGAGFAAVTQKGSEHRDEITPQGFLSNHTGGILGGISTGQDIVVRVAFKPAASIKIPGKSIDIAGNPVEIITEGRHDPCVGLRAVPICEAMMALTLVDAWLLHQCRFKIEDETYAEI